MARDRQTAATRDPRELAKDWAGEPGTSGSAHGEFTLALLNQACGAIWSGADLDPRLIEVQQTAALQAMRGIGPRDPIEGMLAAQMVATHQAAMECYRRASIPEQTFAGRDMALRHAGKLARSYAALLDTLNRHRGKGQQVVRVEHVHVHAGGQAVVGAVNHPGGGAASGKEHQPHARQALADAREPALRGADAGREPVPVARGDG